MAFPRYMQCIKIIEVQRFGIVFGTVISESSLMRLYTNAQSIGFISFSKEKVNRVFKLNSGNKSLFDDHK